MVTKNVNPYSLIIGVPGIHNGWISKHGIKLNLPKKGKGQTTCEMSGDKYMLQNNQCVMIGKNGYSE